MAVSLLWVIFVAKYYTMKRITCPKCEHTFSFDESRYSQVKSISFACPACRKHFSLTLDEIEEMNREEIDAPYGYITVIENQFCYRQTFALKEGDNVIGRHSPGSVSDISIQSGDMSMDRRHCIINVKPHPAGTRYTLRDNPSLTGTFLRNEILNDRERANIKHEDVVTIGATTFIVYLPEAEEDEYLTE